MSSACTLDATNTCTACDSSHYCSGGVQVACPSGSTASNQKAQLSDCKCAAGTYLTTGSPPACTNCAAPYYCLAGTYGTQTSCPLLSSTTVASATSMSACQCQAGYYLDVTANSNAGSCMTCPANMYCPTNTTPANQKSCPTNSTSGTGSAQLTDCKCNSGYILDTTANSGAGACVQCTTADTYCPGGTIAAVNCPANSHTISGAGSAITDCICTAGLILNSNGSGSCDSCLANYYCIGDNTKTLCPADSTSAAGSSTASSCKCAAGKSMSSSSECVLCVTGKYCPLGTTDGTQKSCPSGATTTSQGAAALTDCQCSAGTVLNTSSNSGAGSCDSCPVNNYCPGNNSPTPCPSTTTLPTSTTATATSVTSITGCYCPSGYYFESGACKSCPLNSVCSSGSSNSIQSCPSYMMTTSTGQTATSSCACPTGSYLNSSSTCTTCEANYYCAFPAIASSKAACPDGSRAPAGSIAVTACLCNDGTYMNTGNTQCVQCDGNSYCNAGVKTACPSGSSSSAGSVKVSDCTCASGKYLKQDSTTGAWSCATCDFNYFCTSGKVQTKCPDNAITTSTGSTSSSACKCLPGYYRLNNVCVTCPVDNYCPGTTNGSNDNTKIACSTDVNNPRFTNSNTGISDLSKCYCIASKYLNTNLCTDCVAGSYCPGNNMAYSCPTASSGAASTSLASYTTCACPAGSYWIPGDYFATTSTQGRCQDCEQGFYCPGGNERTACPSGSSTISTKSTAVSSCNCPSGTYQTSAGCADCPIGSYCATNAKTDCTNGKTTSATKASALSDCKCPAGTYESSGACVLCSSGSYCADGSQSITCDATKSSSGYGQTSCTCNAGYYLDTTTKVCTQCTANSYCNGAADNLAKACPSGTTSTVGSTSLSDCKCAAGNYLSNGACVACPANNYCPGDNSVKACPSMATSAASAKLITDCMCPAGQYNTGSTTPSICVTCVTNTYCPGNNVVTNCPSGTTSIAGAIVSTQCETAGTGTPATVVQTTTLTQASKDRDLSNAQIIGIAFGILAFVLLVVIAIAIMLINQKKKIATKKSLYKSPASASRVPETPQAYNLGASQTYH